MAEEPSFYDQLTELARQEERRHLLDGAFVKLDRAAEHLTTLKREARSFREKHSHEITGQQHRMTGQYLLTVTPKKIPDTLTTLASDVLCNVRPALDYLVYALAFLDAGEPQKGTQFPICDTPKRFERKRSWLKGLSKDHIAAIERLQPYDGRKDQIWLRWLRDLSNPDKHRHLNIMVSTVGGGFETLDKPRRLVRKKRGTGNKAKSSSSYGLEKVSSRELAAFARRVEKRTKPEAEKRIKFSIPPGHKLAGADVYVQLGLTFDITFDDGLPVVEMLHVSHALTRKLVKTFEPEFQR